MRENSVSMNVKRVLLNNIIVTTVIYARALWIWNKPPHQRSVLSTRGNYTQRHDEFNYQMKGIYGMPFMRNTQRCLNVVLGD